MPTINMPPKKEAASDDAPPKASQGRPALERYRLQVDRQTKASFKSSEEAEKAGKAIKKTYPLVQVSIYDAEQSQQKLLD